MQHDPSLLIVDVGVDYLTCTTRRDDAGECIKEMADHLMQEMIDQGYEQRLWKGQGYHGKAAGGVQWGLRHDGHIVRLSSTAAAGHYRQFILASRQVSRIDLQATMYDASHLADRAHLAYYQIDDAPRRGGRPPSASLRLNKVGGQTLYVGSRTSDIYGRFYDKGIESKTAPAGHYWRQEIEAKRSVARSLAANLSSEENHTVDIASTVVGFFSRRGIPGASAGQVAGGLNLVADRRDILKPVSDRERKLRWLSKAVAPSVAFVVESGGREEVLRALGLGEE